MTTGEATGEELTGKLLGGRYRVTSTIGRGGMGVVARAVDELLNREVAVKVLRAFTDTSAPELADLRVRMRREAQAAARIRHSGVVTVHDVTEEQGLPVIVMELVDGPSLDDVLTEHGTLKPRQAAAIGAKLMDALDAAHRAGVLHRDVKPGNVLLERGGRVVLTDFGIASMDAPGDDAMAKLTRSGQLVGSLDYLPPERAQGREPGPASDIWSLGMTLYAAVEGTSAFRRTSVWSTLSAIVTEPLPEPRRAGPLTPVLQALMAKDPQSRPTAERARAMLEQVAAGGAASPAPSGSGPAPSGSGPAPSASAPAPSASVPAPSMSVSPPSAPASAPSASLPTPSVGVPTPTEPAAPAPPGFGPPPSFDQPAPLPSSPPFPQSGAAAAGAWPSADPAPAAVGGRRRGRALIAGAAAIAVVAGGGVTYALVGKDGGTQRAAAVSASPADGGPAGDGATATGTHPAAASPSMSSGTKPSGKATPPASAPAKQPSAKSSPVSTSCGGWNHQDPKPGSYGYMSGNDHLMAGPYQACSAVTLARTGTKLWYHCYVVNAYGHTWVYARVAGTHTSGWMSADNLTRQSGLPPRCQ
ncbi:serine/threonine-protein kinase [Streptomyces orinoci]|uniref:non-specific serine/threonine protein kinase n=1 Tax=Streptomyces orinoci TaxID=67339 RepID=A0ABV3K6V4_STRON|nr:serine/threonine-protein kinase [Streptomyces orinoci]